MEVCWLSLGKMPRLQGRVCRLGGKETTWRAGKFLLLVHPVCAERGNPHCCSRSLQGEQGLNEAQVKAASSLSQPGNASG